MSTKVTTRYPHEPDYAVPPGETLAETIEALHMDQRDLASRTGLSEKHVSQIINGHAAITPETAAKLERVTGVPARMWNNLEATYQERRARIAERERLKHDLVWLKTIPVRELVRRGLIEPVKDKVQQIQAVLRFFGVDSPAIWNEYYLKASPVYRKSASSKMKPGPTATWIRIGELKAQAVQSSAYDSGRFSQALAEIRKLTTEPPKVFEPRMKSLCAEAGVALVFVREIKGCPVSGLTRWLSPTKALIQMSLRHKTDDQFWFTFFHEAGHILRDGKNEVFIHDNHPEPDREKKANRFAAEFLIPSDAATELQGLTTRTAIVAFAGRIGIAPGIVLGRLQKEGAVPWATQLNSLKKRFAWADQ